MATEGQLRGAKNAWLAFAHGVGIGLTAVGAMTALKYAGEKAGVALVLALGPSRSKDGDGPKG